MFSRLHSLLQFILRTRLSAVFRGMMIPWRLGRGFLNWRVDGSAGGGVGRDVGCV